MAAIVYRFPAKLADGTGKMTLDTEEACAPFVQRMIDNAKDWMVESPSAAAVFMQAAASRLQREAIERGGFTVRKSRRRSRRKED